MDFVSQNIVNGNIVSRVQKKTTLNPDYRCDTCGEPAMVRELAGLSCPKCYLKKQGQQIKGLDHAGYYP
jgi:formylmethanofuran dehydrogenase subunit E